MTDHGDIEEEYLTCYICYDVFTEPKTLACLHHFCERCLQGYLVGLSESHRKRGFPCPVCREENPAPDLRRPAADWAALLRTDFHLKNLINALKVKAEDRLAAAAVKPAAGGRGKGVVHPCDLHAEKELDLYCVDCSSSICHLCAGISHRGCAQVITLAEAAADHRATAQLQQRHLNNRLGELAQFRAQIDSAVASLSGQRDQAERSIRQRAQLTMAAVRRRETELVEDLTRKHQSLQADVAKRLVALDNKMTACRQVLETMTGKMMSASDADVVHSLSAVLTGDLLDVDQKTINAVLLRIQRIRLQHCPPVHGDGVNLGEVSLDIGKAHPTSSSSSSASAASTSSNTPSTRLTTQPPPPSSRAPRSPRPPVPPRRLRSQTLATMETADVTNDVITQRAAPVKVRTISGKFREDAHSPKLRDLLVLPADEGKVVLATDWANQCIKAFHERRDRDSRLGLGGKPWCLTRVTDTTVAVSLPVSSQICVVKLWPRLALLSSFFAQKRYSGLAALDADTLVASGGSDPPCVDVINLGGEVLRSFSHDADTGAQLFAYPGYISMMPDRRHFLVSDRRKAALFCLDTSGHVKFVFRPEGSMGLREPNGVRADGEGGVLLAEARGVVRVRVTGPGRDVRPVLRTADGVEEPRGVALCAAGLVYVTTHETDIAVFKVS